MSAPRATVPLVLESPQRVADQMGGYRVDWHPLGVLYAEMRAGKSAQRQGEVAAENVVPWRITVRAAPGGDPRRPQPEQRFRMGERIFRIDAVAEADAAGLWLTCQAKEERLS